MLNCKAQHHKSLSANSNKVADRDKEIHNKKVKNQSYLIIMRTMIITIINNNNDNVYSAAINYTIGIPIPYLLYYLMALQ